MADIKDCATCKHQNVAPWDAPCNTCPNFEKHEEAPHA